MTYKVYNISIDCGRMGSIDGTYLAVEGALDKFKGHRFYADDVLGKHSEISFVWGDGEYEPDISESKMFEGVDFSPVYEREKKDIIHIGGFGFLDCLEEPEEDD